VISLKVKDTKMDNINTNYHTLKGQDISELDRGGKYQEYRTKWHENPKNFIVEDFPLFLDVEATSACNLKCPYCAQTHGDFRKGFISWKLYQRIIDEAASNNCFGIKFHTIGRGEPLLHKGLPRMVAYAKFKGLIDVYLNTNGTLLTEGKSKALLDAGLDRISFSVDGHSKETYEGNRVGANYDKVVEKIAEFRAICAVWHYKTKIRIQTVDLPGIDLQKYYGTFWPLADEVSYIDYKSMHSRVYNLISDWSCPQLWQRLSILWDGTILPCNHDDRLKAKLGTFPEMSISDAWFSETMINMRMGHSYGYAHRIEACDGCFLRTAEVIKEGKWSQQL